jgi:hypothetical protein
MLCLALPSSHNIFLDTFDDVPDSHANFLCDVDKNGAKHDRALYADLLNTGAARSFLSSIHWI